MMVIVTQQYVRACAANDLSTNETFCLLVYMITLERLTKDKRNIADKMEIW